MMKHFPTLAVLLADGIQSARPLRRRRFSAALCLTMASALWADPSASATPAPRPPPPRLRVKNAHSVRVVLGRRRREPASAIRPQKGVWRVILASKLAGASAELQDLTPNAPRSRWVVKVKGDQILLDAGRFLPSHVYQMDVRQGRRLIGSALVYLYPPPVERVSRVQFRQQETTKKADSGKVSIAPKGDL
jgi:hypothetical protein